jgi:anti-anti-sigma regulatory factor
MEAGTGEEGQTRVLALEGSLDIQRASELKEVLLDAQESAGHLLLNLAGVTGADISGLQLLCAAHRRAAKLNKPLTRTGDESAAFRQAVMETGYERGKACPFGSDHDCLWRRE